MMLQTVKGKDECCRWDDEDRPSDKVAVPGGGGGWVGFLINTRMTREPCGCLQTKHFRQQGQNM